LHTIKTSPKTKISLKSNAIKGTFVGFNMESNCYMIMDNKEYNIHLVREVVFDEQTPSTLKTKENSSKLPTNIFNNNN